ncbi:MAG: flagellar hook-associated protein FlgK [Rhizobiaceae bacterium]|nr:flagellar hook-associated protein FlgK [Rhizobiaceae bacterium]
MSLNSALRIATGSLAATSQRVSTLSSNIAGVGNPNYVRRESVVTTGVAGIQNIEITRYVNQSMMRATLSSTSNASYQGVLAGGIQQLSVLQDADGFAGSPAALLGDLESVLQLASSAPADIATLTSVVETARNTVRSINSAYQQTLDMRAQADTGIQASVTNINRILAQIKVANDDIVNGTRTGDDVLDYMDNRDALVRELSEELGINVRPRGDNDILITTDSGVILFETQPRSVEFSHQPVYGANTVGNELYIDGVPVTGANSPMAISSGAIVGHFQMRDQVLVEHQNQLDEFSRGLVEVFAEIDQVGAKPPLAGLFTWFGGPAIPATGTLTPGMGQTLTVNPLIDPSQGGDLSLIRDGGINGDPDYIVNTAGSSGFSDHLLDLSARFDVTSTFDAQTGLLTAISLRTFASTALDSLQTQRQTSANAFEYQSSLQESYMTALLNESGPNLDFEMSKLLEAERAYQATAKIIAAVDELFDTLLSVVR